MSSLSISRDQGIPVGQGDYVVYHQHAAGGKTAPSRGVFDAIFPALNKLNSPAVGNRYELLRREIQKTDPTLELTFVPKTYYELRFLRNCIQEDVDKNEYCEHEQVAPDPHRPKNIQDCWHIAYFKGEEDDNAEAVKVLAFRMNHQLVETVKKYPSQLSFGMIEDMTKEQLQFFRTFHDTFDISKGFKKSCFKEAPPVVKFSSSGRMGIRNEKDEQLILNSVKLECSDIAAQAFLLYRGSLYSSDQPCNPYRLDEPYSFSFGSSVFAGALYRQGATAFVYARDVEDGYVIAIPGEGLAATPFVIPKKHTISQLAAANGLVFHPRTKVWRTEHYMCGFGKRGAQQDVIAPFYSDLSREALSDQVLHYKRNNVVFLKSAHSPLLKVPSAFQPVVHVQCQIPVGKTLYIRGGNAGLIWEKGKPLVQVADDQWVYRFSDSFERAHYKILIDDIHWEEGDNHLISHAGKESVTPSFSALARSSLKPRATRLTFRYDTGLGKSLSIRGSGPRMSWQSGIGLKNVGPDMWVWETSERSSDFQYKLLINDSDWEKGPNHFAQGGSKEELTPNF